MAEYKKAIGRLIAAAPFPIDVDVQVAGHGPTMASSQFLTNREQGDWAEEIVLNAVNEHSGTHVAVPYGRADSLAAGDPGFAAFYREYQQELNSIGKKPDLLIFPRKGAPDALDLSDESVVRSAVAAVEVRSSSFLAERYASFMQERMQAAENECIRLREEILRPPLSGLLKEKNPEIHGFIAGATKETFKDLNFRAVSWSSSADLMRLSEALKSLKAQIKILHKRDFLSITPKLEDLALVNRWIQRFGVKHYYLQVFFDKAYVIPFQSILEICSDSRNEGQVFSVERDVKNQGKTTIKVNVQVGKEILGRIDMPEYSAALKELERGRLLFYVRFSGGRGYLDLDVFKQELVNGG